MIPQREYMDAKAADLSDEPVGVRILAYVFSILFHPVFIPVFAVAWLAFIQQEFFLGISDKDKTMIVIRVAVNTLFFPLLTVLLLKGLGFIKSILLKDQRDRIIPYVAANIFYFWMFLVFNNQPEVPSIVTSFILGVFLASSIALVVNSFFKISMHAMGMGAFVGLVLIIIYGGHSYGTFLPMMLILFLTGVVCTSRMIISNHTLFDIASGILLGIVSQVVAGYFILS